MVGINAKNKLTLDRRYLCCICSLIIRDPIQLLNCGHRLCQSCVNTPNRTISECPDCLDETRDSETVFDQGFQNDIQLLPIECFLCAWTGKLNQYQDHLDQHHQHPVCSHCNQQCHSVNNLNEHQISQCKKLAVGCLLKDFGCNEHVTFGDLIDHYLSEQHQNSLDKYFLQLQMQMDCERKSSIQNNINHSYRTNVVSVDINTMLLRELCEHLSTLIDDKKILEITARQRLNTALHLCQKKFPLLTPNFFRTNASFEEMKFNRVVPSSEEQIEDLQIISYDGILTWKISNFTEKMADAQTERQTSIYSPLFRSSPTGYKMRARLFLYGDGNARRTHMSIFFVLMRSEYDAILEFPFNYRITFCLYDQSDEQRHIIRSFQPDIASNSFQRPRSDMNIASGIPKFAPLAMIQQEGNSYVRDDTMFIRIMVDFERIPQILLPYALSLNPGLPMNVQRMLIEREMERRARQNQANQPREGEK